MKRLMETLDGIVLAYLEDIADLVNTIYSTCEDVWWWIRGWPIFSTYKRIVVVDLVLINIVLLATIYKGCSA